MVLQTAKPDIVTITMKRMAKIILAALETRWLPLWKIFGDYSSIDREVK